jgi:hypothetical protein
MTPNGVSRTCKESVTNIHGWGWAPPRLCAAAIDNNPQSAMLAIPTAGVRNDTTTTEKKDKDKDKDEDEDEDEDEDKDKDKDNDFRA